MKLDEFLALISMDREAMRRFRSSPESTMTLAGLSTDAQRSLGDPDPAGIRKVIRNESAKSDRPTTQKGRGDFDQGLDVQPEFAPPPIEFNPPPIELNAPPIGPGIGPPDPFEPPEQPHGPEPEFEPMPMEIDPPGIIEPVALSKTTAPERFLFQSPASLWDKAGLTVVGTGMRGGLQITRETELCVEGASRLLYLVGDSISEQNLRAMNSNSDSIGELYTPGRPRLEIYDRMVTRILSDLEKYGDLCVAFYGHPGMLSYPARESIRRARLAGFPARMLPAISTQDSLFADLGLDIGTDGLQSYEATRFLVNEYKFDVSSGLLLWQIGVLGEQDWDPPHHRVKARLRILMEYLLRFYNPDHQAILYYASSYPTSGPIVEIFPLASLAHTKNYPFSTLYIPPQTPPVQNKHMLSMLMETR